MTTQPTSLPNDDAEHSFDPGLIDKIIADQKVRREVTRRSHMMFFSVYFSEYLTYPMADFHWEMFRLTESEDRMAVLMAFRGSGKSTIFTLSYPIWALLGTPQKKFVVILAQTQQQAKLYIANIKRELESNQLLRNDLGPFYEREEEWSSGTLVFPRHGARITALSTEQSIRGQRHGANRPDLIICDDLEDLSSVKTYESRTRTYQWLTGDVIPAGDVHTKVIVIGNMLHEDSLLMRLKKDIEEERRDGVFRSFPLLNEDGSPAWPGKFRNQEDVTALHRAVGDDGAWSREYLLKIVSDAEQVVHPDWIQYYDGEPPSPDLGGYHITGIGIDLAISQKTTADFTAMVFARVVTINKVTKVYILPNSVNEHLTFPETIERIKALYNSFSSKEHRKVYVENVGYQESVIQQLEHDGIHGVEGVNPMGQDKRARLALTTHHIQSGHVLFPREGAEDLIRQLVGFGKESHDDLADAFTILILKLEEYIRLPTPGIFIIGGDRDGYNYLYDGYPFTRGLRTKLF